MPPEFRKRSKSLIRSLCAYLMRQNNLCYTQHIFSIGALSMPKMKKTNKKTNKQKQRNNNKEKQNKNACASMIILIYLDTQRRPENDVLSHEVKKIRQKFGKIPKTQDATQLLKLVHNMCKFERIRLILYKTQSGHDLVCIQTGIRTGGQTDGLTKWNQYTPLTSLAEGIKRKKHELYIIHGEHNVSNTTVTDHHERH